MHARARVCVCVCVLEAWFVKLSQVVYRMETHMEDNIIPDHLWLPRCLLEEPDANVFLMVFPPPMGVAMGYACDAPRSGGGSRISAAGSAKPL